MDPKVQFPDRIHEALVDIFGEKGKLIKTYHAEASREGYPTIPFAYNFI